MASVASPTPGHTALTPSLMAFYATVATVIPVLFIVLAVQGTTYHEIIRLLIRLVRNVEAPRLRTSLPGVQFAVSIIFLAIVLVLWFVLWIAACFIVVAGGVGEFYALYALYQGYDLQSGRQTVLMLVMVLVIVVVAGPTLDAVKLFKAAHQESRQGRQDSGKAALPAALSTQPDKTPTAESDKTDAE